MGIGNTTPAATLIGLLTGHDADAVTGRGTGHRRRDAGTQARRPWPPPWRAGRDVVDDPVALLARVGSPDIAAMTGYLHARAPPAACPVILDGVVSCAAALVAERLAPGARAWWVAGHRSTEPASRLALDAPRPHARSLDLGLRLGEGTGALLALPLLAAAAPTLAEMATFDSAGVSDREARRQPDA